MNQVQQDAVIMRQIIEAILGVLHDNNIMFSKQSINRVAQILMAWSVTMVGMSSNDVADFKTKSQKMVDNIVSMLETMEPMQRAKMMKAVNEQMEWFEKTYALNKEHAEDLESISFEKKLN